MALAADGSNVYAAQPAKLIVVDTVQQAIMREFGLDSNSSGLLSVDGTLWSYNTQTGFIYAIALE